MILEVEDVDPVIGLRFVLGPFFEDTADGGGTSGPGLAGYVEVEAGLFHPQAKIYGA